MHYRVLGPVRVEQDGEGLPLGGPQQRLLLSLLIAAEGRVVSSAQLIDAMWGDESPPTAKKIIQGYVSKLRSVIGIALVTDGGGYSLSTDGKVDSLEFERLCSDGKELLDVDPTAAASSFRAALALWDGSAYADLADELALRPDIARLENARIAVLGDRVEADLRCGAHRGLIGELEGLTQEYPFEDRFRAQHMLALHRAGRKVEALRSFERTRRFLAEEMGMDPSAELRQLEQKILSDDESLSLWRRTVSQGAGRPSGAMSCARSWPRLSLSRRTGRTRDP
jgi:DNA-binding SARP family transcriptional activator